MYGFAWMGPYTLRNEFIGGFRIDVLFMKNDGIAEHECELAVFLGVIYAILEVDLQVTLRALLINFLELCHVLLFS